MTKQKPFILFWKFEEPYFCLRHPNSERNFVSFIVFMRHFILNALKLLGPPLNKLSTSKNGEAKVINPDRLELGMHFQYDNENILVLWNILFVPMI